KAPTLLVIGDADIVRPEHTVQMFRLLGGGVAGDLHGLTRAQLAVLPGTTHISVVQRVEWLVSMVTAFTDAPSGDWKRCIWEFEMQSGSDAVFRYYEEARPLGKVVIRHK